MTTILTAAIPIILKLLQWAFGKSDISKEQKEAFLKFYEAHEKLGNQSVKEMDDINKQLEELKKE